MRVLLDECVPRQLRRDLAARLSRRPLDGAPLSMIRAVAFDLDHTLLDPESLAPELFEPILLAVRRANTGPDAIPSELLEGAFVAARRQAFSIVADAYRLPASIQTAWREANRTFELNSALTPYPDVLPALHELRILRFLVTTGFRRTQLSKVRALGIEDLFDAIYIDGLDEGMGSGKRPLLTRILVEYRLRSSELLVVGDSAESEIAAGNALGAVTVQVLRPHVLHSAEARFHVRALSEIPALITQL